MDVKLVRIHKGEAKKLWEMQIRAFQDLYEKYQDTETSPAAESVDRIRMKLKQPFTYYYFIMTDNIAVGAIRVVDKRVEGTAKRISPIFIMPEHRNNGLAQAAIKMAEQIHGHSNWELDTILEENGNCHLYEKMGYHRTGEVRVINDIMTLVFYKKD